MGKDQDLLEAARIGNIAMVGKLLEQISRRHTGPFSSFRRSPSINSQDVNGYTPLHHACLNGHSNVVRLLLAHNAAPDVPDIRGSTPLYLAAWAGRAEIVKQLLMHPQKPANPNAQTIDNETPLHCAAQHGHNTVLAILLAYGADPAIRNNSFQTALDLAAQFGRLQAVQTLIRHHPVLLAPYRSSSHKTTVAKNDSSTSYEISPTTHIFTHTCLHLASRNGHKKVVEALLAAGIDVNIMTHAGTALHEAALCGKKDVVVTLLKAGVDPNARNGNGETALDLLKDYPHHVTYEITSAINDFYKETINGTHFRPISEVSDNDDNARSDGSVSPEFYKSNYESRAVPKSIYERRMMHQKNDASNAAGGLSLMPKTTNTKRPLALDANNNKHSPTPDFPPPTVTQAEVTIMEFMRPQSVRSKRRSMRLKAKRHGDLESFIVETLNQLEMEPPDSPFGSRTSDCVEEFVGDRPFAGLFKGSTLNLVNDDDDVNSNCLVQEPSGLRSPSLVRSVKPIVAKSPMTTQRQNFVVDEDFNASKVWAEIDTILENIGNEFTSNTEQIIDTPVQRFVEITDIKNEQLMENGIMMKNNDIAPIVESNVVVKIRDPTDLLIGSERNCTPNWCHSPNTLIYGQIQYTVYYLGSTVIRELQGTSSTRKSIQKFKRNAKRCDKLRDLKAQNRLEVSIALSSTGVKFIDVNNQTTICKHDIENIHCVCQDAEDLRYFAYITKENDMHYCHVFNVENLELTREIILTLGEAFEVAYQLALKKDSSTTNIADKVSD